MSSTARTSDAPRPTTVARLRDGGIVDPQTAFAEAHRAGLALPLACAVLEKASDGGRNVFGMQHSIFRGAGAVTEAKYRAYKRQREESGNTRMQGVGPCQLTWWELQDDADREGGCWRPEINMRVGFRHLADLVKTHGEADGCRVYYGTGAAAGADAQDLVAKARGWERRLAGLAATGTAAAPAVRRPVRDRHGGQVVSRLSRGLSYVRDPATGRPYLDGARTSFDAETRRALAAFQRDSGLTPTQRLDRETARKLNEAVRGERARRAPRAEAARSRPPSARVASLVDEAERAAAASRGADGRLIERGRRLEQAVRKLRPRSGADDLVPDELELEEPIRSLEATSDGIAESRAQLAERVARLDQVRRELEQKQPYPGPRPFEDDEERLFFGRERELSHLRSLVLAHSMVLLYGQSGAGKTSLLRAGLVPALRKAAPRTTVFPVARLHRDRATDVAAEVPNPFVRALVANWADGQRQQHIAGVTDLESFVEALKGTYGVTEDEPRVLIIDQFEELFTIPEDWESRGAFFEQAQQALDADRDLRIVLSMREDFVAETDPYGARVRNRLQHRFRIQPLKKAGALDAVTKPLEPTGYSFAPEAAEHLVDQLLQIKVDGPTSTEVPGEFVEPVQLQIVCASLWDRITSADEPVLQIDKATLVELAPVDRALADFYSEVVDRAADETHVDPVRIRRWCEEKLVTPGGTRALVYRGDTETAGMPNAVVEKLDAAHLVRREERAGAPWYELSHDKFVEPIRESNRQVLEQEFGRVSDLSDFVANTNDRVLSALSQLRTGDDSSRRAALRTVEATFLTGTPLSERVGDEVKVALKELAGDRTVTDDLRRRAETVLLAANDSRLGAEFLDDPLRSRLTARSLLARRIQRRPLWLGLAGVFVLLVTSMLVLWTLTDAAVDDSQFADTTGVVLCILTVGAIWTLAYGLETVANFPLESFRRSPYQIIHTLTAPGATLKRGALAILALPFNLIVPWVAGAGAGAAVAEAFDESPDAAFLVVTVLLTVILALWYRAEV